MSQIRSFPSAVNRLHTLQLRTHRKQHHLHLPIQRTSLSWVDWKKDSPTMRQHSSKQIDVHQHIATSFTTRHHTHSSEFVPLASPVESSENMTTCSARPSNILHLFSHSTLEQTTRTSSPRADSTSGQHPGHPHASQAAASPTYLSRHLSAASRMQVLDQQIELIVTASEGPVWSGQHLEHNAQRQEAPTRSTTYFAATIEGKNQLYV